MTLLNRGVRLARNLLVGASAAGQALNADSSPLVVPRSNFALPGAGGLAAYARAPPPSVGPLPIPLEALEAGGVGPRGAAGSAPMGGLLVSASSYPANAPVEDRFDARLLSQSGSSGDGSNRFGSSEKASAVKSSGSSRLASGALLTAVFDGHGGWQAAEYARRNLLARVAQELEGMPADVDDPTALGAALARSFTAVDKSFLDAVKPAFGLGFGDLAHVGACALAAIITPRHIVVANAGDCRAVLGFVSSSAPSSNGVVGDEEHSDGHAAAAAALVEGRGDAVRNVPAAMNGNGDTFNLLPEPSWKWHRLSTSDVGLSSGSGALNDEGKGGSDQIQISRADSLPGAPKRERATAASLYFTAIPMSLDHNAREARERVRLTREHPGETDIVVCKKDSPSACYVKSRLQPTRALGDAYLKSADFNAPPNAGRQWGRHIRDPYTPPYISRCERPLS